METQSSVVTQTDSPGVTQPLDAAYLDSLFAGDPEDIEPISDQEAEKEPARTDKETGPQKEAVNQSGKNKPETFIDKDLDFIEDLDVDKPTAANEPLKRKKLEEQKQANPNDEPEQSPPPGGEHSQPDGETQLQQNIAAFSQELFDVGIL